jgi:hypothetical protein
VAWNRDLAWVSASTASDIDLGAGDIELWWGSRVVKTNLLNTDEVLTRWGVPGDGGGVRVAQWPARAGAGEGWSLLLDFEPGSSRSVPVLDVAWSFAEVPRDWTLMVDSLVEVKLDSGAGWDAERLGLWAGRLTANVAAEIL